MKSIPYQEKIVGEVKRRIFKEVVEPSELVWHRDKADRQVLIKKNTDWLLQMDNELPKPLLEGKTYFIPKETYHRVIKGSGDLIVEIRENGVDGKLLGYLDEMGYDYEDAIIELSRLKKYIKDLPSEIILYRIIRVDSKDEIDTESIGSHFSREKEDLLMSHDYVTGVGNRYYLITVLAKKRQVDVEETITKNILYPNEQEITLKNLGRGVKILKILRIKFA
jgi:hypothetical protein